ncbi:FUSC family protein [Sporosarcina sp. BI001-red]|uniref:FUSC family protein n=1 Tax=Sporosarcina sp. BI001-red TaxID=2282866 RepID=UPI000E2832DB|nr:FUSC family protein [Sporosarcina sp. BI001-red]REB05617.1 FUSC family protein [Sporosarcina sp. BI001-red]
MTKKKIIGNTLLFVGIMAYILLFGALFGQNNILIGVATITAMLMLLERDLTIHPVQNTVKFAGLNLLTGIAAFAAGFSVWTAVPIHFVMMFIISYTLIFNLKNPLYLPFSLQYLFLLAIPVTGAELPLRLVGLVVGAISIMALQMLVNRKRISKNGDPIVKSVCTSLLGKIDKKLAGEDSTEMDTAIRKSIGSLRSMIYDQREEDYYLTEEGRLRLNITAALEKMDTLLDTLEPRHAEGKVIQDVRMILNKALEGDSKEINARELSKASEEVMQSYMTEPPQSSTQLRLLNNIDYLTDSLLALQQLTPEKRKITRKIEEIPLKFKKFTLNAAPLHVSSLKMSYAVRMATGIAISGFLMDFFDLTEGRWMMFTVLSVIIPFYEQSHKKMRDRIFATVVGATLVWIVFSIFQVTAVRTGLLLFAGYLMSYVKVYRYSTILVTFSAIGSVALISGETQFLTVERLLMVLAGVFIALLINRFVLPYKMTDANVNLGRMSNDTLTEMLKEAKDAINGNAAVGSHSMKNLLIISTMIEERARVNLQAAGTDVADELFAPRRLASNTLYELLMWKEMHGMKEEISLRVVAFLQQIETCWLTGVTYSSVVKHLHLTLASDPILENRIILSIVLEIAEEFEQIQTEDEKVKPHLGE